MRRLGSILAAAALGLFAATAVAQAGGMPPEEGGPPPGAPATCPCPHGPGPGGGFPGKGRPYAALKDAANVTVENNASGAVVRFQAKSGSQADLEKAREAAQIVAKKFQSGGCPMMGPGSEGGSPPGHGG